MTVIDPQTVEAARRGDDVALSAIVQAVWPVAYRTAFAILHDAEAAKDAAQDACALMCVKLTSLRDVSAFDAWFGRIAATQALRALRGRSRFVSLDDDVADRANVCDDVTERLSLFQAIDALPRALRAPLVLHYVQGLHGEEIARALRIAHGTVRYRLCVARRRLLESLQRQATATEVRFDRVPARSALRSHEEMI
jgi:RNA polymerase sigma-70 factor (ECF subfamily)